MTLLFASLAGKTSASSSNDNGDDNGTNDNNNNGNNDNGKNKSAAYPPTAVQIYSTKHIHFISNTISKDEYEASGASAGASASASEDSKLESTNGNPFPHYEMLSYQPVHVYNANDGDNNGAAAKAGKLFQQKAKSSFDNPNLGIWDCRFIPSSSSSPSSTLSSSSAPPSTETAVAAATTTTTNGDTVDEKQQTPDSKKDASLVTEFLNQVLSLAPKTSTSTSASTSASRNTKTAFILTIDLDRVEHVQPTLSGMMQSIHEHDQNKRINSKHIVFGTAPEEKQPEHERRNQQANGNDNDDDDDDEIIIAAILPKQNSDATYKEKQSLNLVFYHLMKFAHDLNCTLCFLRNSASASAGASNDDDVDGAGGDNNKDEQQLENAASGNGNGENGGGNGNGNGNGLIPRGMSVEEFATIVRNVCCGEGLGLVQGGVAANDGGEEKTDQDSSSNATTEQRQLQQGQNQNQNQPSLYQPNGHDIELINSVFLRNASCAGVWDASKDSLWVALPFTSFGASNSFDGDGGAEGEKKHTSSGDEEWLSKLAAALPNAAPVSSSGGSVTGTSTGTASSSVAGSNSSTAADDQSTRSRISSSKAGKKKPDRDGRKKSESRKKSSNSGGKKADNEDVADFFSDLLKN